MNGPFLCKYLLRMPYTAGLLLLFTLLLTNCRNTGESEKTTEKTAIKQTDSTALVQLIRNMYQWYEISGLQGDFLPAKESETDNEYKGLDWDTHAQKVDAIKKSSFFSTAFIEDYSKIAFSIDSILHTGNMKWQAGDLAPFSNGADAWCDCQDSPERYWETMNIVISFVNQTDATLSWTWPGKTPYQVKAVKENNAWKIQWLQGLHYEDYKKIIAKEVM